MRDKSEVLEVPNTMFMAPEEDEQLQTAFDEGRSLEVTVQDGETGDE